MATDAQRQATYAYSKKSVRQVIMKFYPGEEDAALYECIRSHENVNRYLKSLVEKDMKNPRHED